METNARRFLPPPRGHIPRAMVVAVFGCLAMAFLGYQAGRTDPLLPFSGDIARAKAWVKDKARDPSSVSFHDVSADAYEMPDGSEWRSIRLNFSWDDEPGVNSLKWWRFEVEGNAGQFEVVKDEGTGEVVAYGSAVLARMRAAEEAAARDSRTRAETQVDRAQKRVDSLPMVPGKVLSATPGNRVSKPLLPVVPGLVGD
ncbi:MAG: hypothetical protein ACO1TE_23395 [Prosthecobacter sp.]